MNITIEIFTTKRKEKFKWLKKTFALIMLILGLMLVTSWVYEGSKLFDTEGIVRVVLAFFVGTGWLNIIYKAWNYLRK